MQNIKKYKTKTGGVFDCRCDSSFTLIQADSSLFSLIGYTQEEFQERFQNQLIQVIYQEEREHILDEIMRQVKKDGVFMYENRLVCKDGTLKWIWISAQYIKRNQEEAFFHCIFHDIEEEKRNEEALKISEKRLEYILSQTQDIVFEYDCPHNEVYYSDNLEKKFGYTIPINGFPDSLFSSHIIYPDDEPIVRNAFQLIRQGKDHMQCEYRLKYRDKGYRWVYTQGTSLRDEEGNLIKILGVITDIHDQKQEIMKSKEEAALDPLTGLYNRRECLRQLEDYISLNDDLFAFILIDIDDFKIINDTYGHTKGDEVLCAIAEELKAMIRPHDIAARLGGDEFVICLMNLPDYQIATNKAERIQTTFEFILTQRLQCEINCSIGISFYPEHGHNYEELFEHADIAMYQSKKEGKGQFSVFTNHNPQQEATVEPQKYMKKTFHDHIIEYVIRILITNSNKQKAMNYVLEFIGKTFDCDRITLYIKENHIFQRSYEWISDPIYQINETHLPVVQELQDKENNSSRIFAYTNIQSIENNQIRQWFTQRLTLAAILCPLKENNDLHMFLCFEDCHSLRHGSGEERYTLRIISDIIHLFLHNEIPY